MAAQEYTPEQRECIRKRIRATIYGNCIGDAIGLLTEFLSKDLAHKIYKRPLEYKHKHDGAHQSRWATGDWTDDSDQMVLIMRSLTENEGKLVPSDFGAKLKAWIRKGFPELNDFAGMGIGRTTLSATTKECFDEDPQQAARLTWIEFKCMAAPNGGVMRTSIVGTYKFNNLETVKENAIGFCTVTHYDPRCQASVVAVSIAISVMIQGESDVETIIEKAYQYASQCLETEEQKTDLRKYLDCKDLSELELDEKKSIGYTYKCLGAGFWALKQKDFRDALEQICMSGGDADTNGAVAGALLACRLGDEKLLPKSWVKNLCHVDWLENELEKYFTTLIFPGLPYEKPPAKKSTSDKCSIM